MRLNNYDIRLKLDVFRRAAAVRRAISNRVVAPARMQAASDSHWLVIFYELMPARPSGPTSSCKALARRNGHVLVPVHVNPRGPDMLDKTAIADPKGSPARKIKLKNALSLQDGTGGSLSNCVSRFQKRFFRHLLFIHLNKPAEPVIEQYLGARLLNHNPAGARRETALKLRSPEQCKLLVVRNYYNRWHSAFSMSVSAPTITSRTHHNILVTAQGLCDGAQTGGPLPNTYQQVMSHPDETCSAPAIPIYRFAQIHEAIEEVSGLLMRHQVAPDQRCQRRMDHHSLYTPRPLNEVTVYAPTI